MTHRFSVRIDEVNEEHVRLTIFANGAKTGELCMRVGEYQMFGALLLLGGAHAEQSANVVVDEEGRFHALMVQRARDQATD